MNQGVRGRVLMKKTRGKISRVSVPLKSTKLTYIILNLLTSNYTYKTIQKRVGKLACCKSFYFFYMISYQLGCRVQHTVEYKLVHRND